MSLTAGMASSRPWRSGRLGRPAELFMLGVLILIFMAVAIDRIWELRHAAEQVGMLRVESAIRSALGIAVAGVVANGQVDGLAALDGSNPMALLNEERLPANYLGELARPDIDALPAYSWHFNAAAGQLVYLVGNLDAFESELPGRARAAFRIRVRFDDQNGNGRFDGAPEHVTGISLVREARFQWRKP